MNKRNIAKILIFLALLSVCAYTAWFGTIKDPVEYTISRIGNYFDLRAGFILWGAITGLLLTRCISYIYKTAGCKDDWSEKFLNISYVLLILTVIVPDIKETMLILFYVHITSAFLFACSLLLSVAFFIRHLYYEKRNLYQTALKLIIPCVAVPLAILAG